MLSLLVRRPAQPRAPPGQPDHQVEERSLPNLVLERVVRYLNSIQGMAQSRSTTANSGCGTVGGDGGKGGMGGKGCKDGSITLMAELGGNGLTVGSDWGGVHTQQFAPNVLSAGEGGAVGEVKAGGEEGRRSG